MTPNQPTSGANCEAVALPQSDLLRAVTAASFLTSLRPDNHVVRLPKYLPDLFIKIRLKIEENCRLCLDIFCSAIMKVLPMTFTSRLMLDAKCVYQQ